MYKVLKQSNLNFKDLSENEIQNLVNQLSGFNDDNFSFETFIKQSALKNKFGFFKYYQDKKNQSLIWILGHINPNENKNFGISRNYILYTPLKFYGDTKNCLINLATTPYSKNTLISYGFKEAPKFDSVYLFAIKSYDYIYEKVPPFKTVSLWDLEWSYEQYLNILDINYNNIICQYKNFINQSKDIEAKIEEKNITLKNIETKIEEKNITLKNIETKIEEKNFLIDKYDKSIDNKKSEYNKIMTLLNEYLNVNLDTYNDFDESLASSTEFTNISEVITHVDAYLKYVLKLDYHNDTTKIIDRFVGALLTNQIIILEGPPGTGKSTLPRAVAKAINAKFDIIPVQPNWVDRADLFGFYNFQDQKFIPTILTDKIIDAINNPDDFYILCLDEMNLAHIEYYFADILSAMEGRTKEERRIELYPNGIFKNILSKIENDSSSFASNSIYPSSIFLPKNLQIVGTLNMDFTTKAISPKVLDRSYIIKLDYERDFTSYKEKNIIPKKYFPTSNYVSSNIKFIEAIEDVVSILNRKANPKYIFSNRTKQHILNMSNFNEMNFLSNTIISKILPRIYIDFEDISELEDMLEEINQLFSTHLDMDFDVVTQFIEKYSDDSGTFDYWR